MRHNWIIEWQVDGKSFTSSDKMAVESFTLFCGMAIHNTQTYEEVSKLSAKQKVAIECLSYHSRASEDEVELLGKQIIPTTEYFNLTKFDSYWMLNWCIQVTI